MKRKILALILCTTILFTSVQAIKKEDVKKLFEENKVHSVLSIAGLGLGALTLTEALFSKTKREVIFGLIASYLTLLRKDSRDYIKTCISNGNLRLVLQVGIGLGLIAETSIYWGVKGINHWIDKKVEKAAKAAQVAQAAKEKSESDLEKERLKLVEEVKNKIVRDLDEKSKKEKAELENKIKALENEIRDLENGIKELEEWKKVKPEQYAKQLGAQALGACKKLVFNLRKEVVKLSHRITDLEESVKNNHQSSSETLKKEAVKFFGNIRKIKESIEKVKKSVKKVKKDVKKAGESVEEVKEYIVDKITQINREMKENLKAVGKQDYGHGGSQTACDTKEEASVELSEDQRREALKTILCSGTDGDHDTELSDCSSDEEQ